MPSLFSFVSVHGEGMTKDVHGKNSASMVSVRNCFAAEAMQKALALLTLLVNAGTLNLAG